MTARTVRRRVAVPARQRTWSDAIATGMRMHSLAGRIRPPRSPFVPHQLTKMVFQRYREKEKKQIRSVSVLLFRIRSVYKWWKRIRSSLRSPATRRRRRGPERNFQRRFSEREPKRKGVPQRERQDRHPSLWRMIIGVVFFIETISARLRCMCSLDNTSLNEMPTRKGKGKVRRMPISTILFYLKQYYIFRIYSLTWLDSCFNRRSRLRIRDKNHLQYRLAVFLWIYLYYCDLFRGAYPGHSI